MPALMTLNCNGCTFITEAGVGQLFTDDSELRRLYIADCYVRLKSLRTAWKWTPSKRREWIIYTDKRKAISWYKSGLKKYFTSSSPYGSKGRVLIYCEAQYRRHMDTDDWHQIFD